MKFIVIPPYQLNDQFDFDTGFKNDLWEYSQHLGSNLYLAMTRSYQAYDDKNFIAWHNCLKIVKCHW
ncbi:hypothetical protein LWM68_31180 [Niabella sp. W65]|nr:hypothetical protein [Niabella sp. W65]MCH7366838.1 hypothetical protein [Niabella sp. W65]